MNQDEFWEEELLETHPKSQEKYPTVWVEYPMPEVLREMAYAVLHSMHVQWLIENGLEEQINEL